MELNVNEILKENCAQLRASEAGCVERLARKTTSL